MNSLFLIVNRSSSNSNSSLGKAYLFTESIGVCIRSWKNIRERDFEEVSNNYCISFTIFFALTAEKMAKAIAHQKKIFEIQKLVKDPI